MAKKYSAQEILDMAVGLIEKDMAADLNSDGKISAADSRLALRHEQGLPDDSSSPSSSGSIASEDVLDKIINRTGSFSYDINGDKLYKQYKDMYEKEGQRAAEDVFGLASALTGGYGNSYGLKQSYDVLSEYSKKADMKRDELENKAYDRFNDETDKLISLYKLLFDKEYNEKKLSAEKLENMKNTAFKAADIGDYSLLEKLGIDTTKLKGDERWDMAQLLAKYSDYSGLKDLGVDLSSLQADKLLSIAELFSDYGDYTLLKLFGVNTANREKEDLLDILIKNNKLNG